MSFLCLSRFIYLLYFSIIISFNFIHFYVWGCFARLCEYQAHAVPGDARRGRQILWDWSYRRLSAATWVLEWKLGSLEE